MRVGPGTSNDPGLERRKRDYRTWEQVAKDYGAALREIEALDPNNPDAGWNARQIAISALSDERTG